MASPIASFTGRICEPAASTRSAVPNPNTAENSETKNPRKIKRSCAFPNYVFALVHMPQFNRDDINSRKSASTSIPFLIVCISRSNTCNDIVASHRPPVEVHTPTVINDYVRPTAQSTTLDPSPVLMTVAIGCTQDEVG